MKKLNQSTLLIDIFHVCDRIHEGDASVKLVVVCEPWFARRDMNSCSHGGP